MEVLSMARPAGGAEVKTIKARCPDCRLELVATTLQPVMIARLAAGGGVLMDAAGRVLCCPFCFEPLDGQLFRKRI